MTREEAIAHACKTIGIAFHSIRDYSKASDCFCSEHSRFVSTFANQGHVLEYVREAVTEKLIRDGFTVDDGETR
jgi:hypothetical protein